MRFTTFTSVLRFINIYVSQSTVEGILAFREAATAGTAIGSEVHRTEIFCTDAQRTLTTVPQVQGHVRLVMSYGAMVKGTPSYCHEMTGGPDGLVQKCVLGDDRGSDYPVILSTEH